MIEQAFATNPNEYSRPENKLASTFSMMWFAYGDPYSTSSKTECFLDQMTDKKPRDGKHKKYSKLVFTAESKEMNDRGSLSLGKPQPETLIFPVFLSTKKSFFRNLLQKLSIFSNF